MRTPGGRQPSTEVRQVRLSSHNSGCTRPKSPSMPRVLMSIGWVMSSRRMSSRICKVFSALRPSSSSMWRMSRTSRASPGRGACGGAAACGSAGQLAQAIERLRPRAAHVVRDRVEARQLGGEDLAKGGEGPCISRAGVWSSTICSRALRLAQPAFEGAPEFRLHRGLTRQVLEAIDLLHAGRAGHIDLGQVLAEYVEADEELAPSCARRARPRRRSGGRSR